jgi:hypothetical protein
MTSVAVLPLIVRRPQHIIAVDAAGNNEPRVLFAYDPDDSNVFVAPRLFTPVVRTCSGPLS